MWYRNHSIDNVQKSKYANQVVQSAVFSGLTIGQKVALYDFANCRKCEYCIHGLNACTEHWRKSLTSMENHIYGMSLDGG